MNGDTGENMARRYPMSFALKCVTGAYEMARTDFGETVWMSRSEVAFLSKGPVGIGDSVMLHIEWPVLLGGEVPLQLMAKAEIVQRSGPLIVAKMTKHEFRTRSLQSPARLSAPVGVMRALPVLGWGARPAVASAAGG